MGINLELQPRLLKRMKEKFNDKVLFKKVSDMESEGSLFVEDGNHGEYRPLPDEFVNVGVPFIRPPNLINGRINLDLCQKINDVAFERVRKGIGKGGDIVLTHNATVGRVALTKDSDPDFVANPQTTVWRAKNRNVIDPVYLYYFMKSNGFQEQLDFHKGSNATFDYVSLTKQRSLVIPILDIDIQQNIGAFLNSFDQKIELNEQTNQSLEQMAQTFFKSWFIDFDPVIDNALAAGINTSDFPDALQQKAEQRKQAQQLPDFKTLPDNIRELFPSEFEQSEELSIGINGWIPKGWKKDNLKSFGKVVTGKTPPKKVENAFDSEGIPFITPTDVDSDVYTLSVARYLTEDGIHAVKNNVIDKGSVCVTCIGSQMGKTVITPKKAVTNQQLNSITLTDESSRNYIFMNLRMRREELFNLGSSGSTMPILNKSSFENLAVLRPSDDALKSFSKFTENHLERILLNSQQNRQLADIRDTLMPKLISGELQLNN
jgi:type I restriction enzyme S subunit